MQSLVDGGRIVLAGVFIIAGLAHFPAFNALCDDMRSRGVPMAATLLIAGSLFQIAAGLLLAMNVARPWAALGLVVFTLASSVMMLDFWNLQGMDKERTLGAFMNNIALCGALVAIGLAGR